MASVRCPVLKRSCVITRLLAAMMLAPWNIVLAQMPLPSAQSTDATRRLDAVIVTSTRIGGPPLDVPASVDLVDGESMRANQPQLNLSESLGAVPSLLVQKRQN